MNPEIQKIKVLKYTRNYNHFKVKVIRLQAKINLIILVLEI